MKIKIYTTVLLLSFFAMSAVAAGKYDFYLNFLNHLGYVPAVAAQNLPPCFPNDVACAKSQKNMFAANSVLRLSSDASVITFQNLPSTIKYKFTVCDTAYAIPTSNAVCDQEKVIGDTSAIISISYDPELKIYKKFDGATAEFYIPQSYFVSRLYSQDLSRYFEIQLKGDNWDSSATVSDEETPFATNFYVFGKIVLALSLALFLFLSHAFIQSIKQGLFLPRLLRIRKSAGSIVKTLSGYVFAVMLGCFVLVTLVLLVVLPGELFTKYVNLITLPLRYATFIAQIQTFEARQLIVGASVYLTLIAGFIYVFGDFVQFVRSSFIFVRSMKIDTASFRFLYILLSCLLILLLNWKFDALSLPAIATTLILLYVFSQRMRVNLSPKGALMFALLLAVIHISSSKMKNHLFTIPNLDLPNTVYLPYILNVKNNQKISNYSAHFPGTLYVDDLMIYSNRFSNIQNTHINNFIDSESYIVVSPPGNDAYYNAILRNKSLLSVFVSDKFKEAFYINPRDLSKASAKIKIDYSCSKDIEYTKMQLNKHTSLNDTEISDFINFPGCDSGTLASMILPFKTDLGEDAIYYFSLNPDIINITLFINDSEEKPVFLKKPGDYGVLADKINPSGAPYIKVYNFEHENDYNFTNSTQIINIGDRFNQILSELGESALVWSDSQIQYLKRLE